MDTMRPRGGTVQPVPYALRTMGGEMLRHTSRLFMVGNSDGFVRFWRSVIDLSGGRRNECHRPSTYLLRKSGTKGA